MPTYTLSAHKYVLKKTEFDPRNDPIVAPSGNAQYGVGVRPPDRTGPHNGQVPDDDEAICIPCDEALIVPDERGSVDLNLVSSKHRFRL